MMKKYIYIILVSFLALSGILNNAEAAENVWCYNFNTNLKISDKGQDVSALQTALSQEGLYEQKITGEFNQYTFSSVIRFQEKYKKEILSPVRLLRGNGFVGANTKIKLNKLYGCMVLPQKSGTATTTQAACTNYFDKVCPLNCTILSDADCCAKNGKYWLKTSWDYACYDTNYGPGCIAGQMCSSIPDGCCPNWCFSASDYDCCIQVGKCWINGQCSLCASATTTLSTTTPKVASSTNATTTAAKTSTSTVNCVDSDEGINEYIYGKVTENSYASYYDTCEGNQLKEWYCSASGKAYQYINCPIGCIDGVCKKNTGNDSSTGIVCNDSDNGKDYHTAGQVTHGDGILINYDVCIDSNTVKENFCDNGYYNYEFYTCPRGCQNNACINENAYGTSTSSTSTAASATTTTPAVSCTDSDGGKNYYAKGNGSGWNMDTEWVKFSDSCYKDSLTNLLSSCSGNTCYLAEKYCEGKYVKTESGIKCPYGCKDGACLTSAISVQDVQNKLADISRAITQLLEEIRKLLK